MNSELLNGLKTYTPLSRKELIDFAMPQHKILIAVNAEKILHATPDTRSIINKNIGFPDGVGAVWALHKKGHNRVVKIPGCELWLDIIDAHFKTKTFYFVGGRPLVIEKTIEKLKSNYTNIKILNYRDGFIKSNNERRDLMDNIAALKPNVVFVAMGSPSQELLMEEMQRRHKATCLGLGGSFDVYTGETKRAPSWWLQNNLEWAYRLIKQPTRFKRQLKLIKFLFLLKINKL